MKSIKKFFEPVDLAKGKPYKQLIIFMIPILISYLFQQVCTVSDAAIVGKYLSAAEVSGVNVVYSLVKYPFFRVNVIERLCKAGYLVENKKRRGTPLIPAITTAFFLRRRRAIYDVNEVIM